MLKFQYKFKLFFLITGLEVGRLPSSSADGDDQRQSWANSRTPPFLRAGRVRPMRAVLCTRLGARLSAVFPFFFFDEKTRVL